MNDKSKDDDKSNVEHADDRDNGAGDMPADDVASRESHTEDADPLAETSSDNVTDAVEADFKDESPENDASSDATPSAASPWAASASDEDAEPENDRTTEAAAAAVVGAAALAAGSAIAGSDETPAQTSDAEEKRRAPVLAYIWLVVLTIGIIYLIYAEMTRSEAFEATAAKAIAAEQVSNANTTTISAVLGDFTSLSETSKAQAAQLAALETKIANALQTIEAIEANVGGGTGSDVSPAMLEAALADVQGVRASAAAAHAATADQLNQLTEAVAALNGRLAPIEARAAKSAGLSLASAILALNDLRDAVAVGKPFNKLLERARAALPNDETLQSAPWTEFGDKGLPTEASLLTDMQDISIAIGQDKLKARLNSGESWLDKAVGGVVGRLKVRRVGAAVEGDGPAAVAARAEAALTDGDLNRAIAEVQSLEGEGAERFAPWLSGAKAVATASADIDAIEEAAVVAADGT